jgi:hypothetical protein
MADRKYIGRYCSIVQSSGMGKSRLVDEFSKDHFLIPINLRKQGAGGASHRFCFTFMVCYTRHLGFPPPDGAARQFLLSFDNQSSYRYFLLSLFIHTKKKILDLGASSKKDLIFQFREYMTKGQTFGGVGIERYNFYKNVVTWAETVRLILLIISSISNGFFQRPCEPRKMSRAPNDY